MKTLNHEQAELVVGGNKVWDAVKGVWKWIKENCSLNGNGGVTCKF